MDQLKKKDFGKVHDFKSRCHIKILNLHQKASCLSFWTRDSFGMTNTIIMPTGRTRWQRHTTNLIFWSFLRNRTKTNLHTTSSKISLTGAFLKESFPMPKAQDSCLAHQAPSSTWAEKKWALSLIQCLGLNDLQCRPCLKVSLKRTENLQIRRLQARFKQFATCKT